MRHTHTRRFHPRQWIHYAMKKTDTHTFVGVCFHLTGTAPSNGEVPVFTACCTPDRPARRRTILENGKRSAAISVHPALGEELALGRAAPASGSSQEPPETDRGANISDMARSSITNLGIPIEPGATSYSSNTMTSPPASSR